MTARDRLLLKLLVPLAAVAAFWFLALHPRIDQLHGAKDGVAAAEAQLDAMRAKLAQAKDDQDKLDDQRRAALVAQRAIPGEADTPDLLRQLQRTAERTNVVIDSVTPAAAAAATVPAVAGATPLSLNLTYKGTYADSQRFLRALGRLVRVTGKGELRSDGRLISLNAVQLAQDDDQITGTVSGAMYVRAAVAPVAAGGTATTTTTPTGG